MSQHRTALLRLESFAGGLNDTDPPHRIGDDQLAVATDVELTPSGGIKRRSGVGKVMDAPATAFIQLLQRHTPSNALSNTEVWAFPNSATNFYRSATNAVWTTVSVSDTGATQASCVTDAASFNGKLYVAYRKAANTDRLHVWDGSSVRRVGISTPSAPTAANTGAGSYAATVRYYKVQFTYADSAGKYTMSDLSEALTFTPSGTGTAARITAPATPDSATRWRVWGSADNVSYYLLADQAVASSTYDDSAAPSTYSSGTYSAFIAAESGAYTPPWSAKYLLVDENRLLIAGAFETTRYANRIGWSAIIGTAATAYAEPVVVSDDERFPPDNYLDLDSDEGGEITGMEMLNGSVYVFKRYAIYKLVRTGDADVPYKSVTVTKVVGALSRKSVVPGEDEAGNPCLYFLSDRGPYRLGAAGLQYLGGDIETLWALVTKRGAVALPHGVYDARRGQVRWWVPRSDSAGVGQYPDTQIIFHVRLGRPSSAGHVIGGWTTTALDSINQFVSSSALLPDNLGTRDTELAPHAIHYNGAFGYPPVVWKYTTSQASDDIVNASSVVTGTTSFLPIATTKTFSLGLGDKGGVRDVYVAATPTAGGVTLSASLTKDFGAETRTKTQTYTGTTTRMPQQIPDLTIADAQYVSLSLTSSTQAAFTVDEVALRVHRAEPV